MYLTNFSTIQPPHILTQEQTIEWLSCAHAHAEFIDRNKDMDEEAFYEKIKNYFQLYGVDETQVSKRGSILKDFTHMNWDAMDVFKLEFNPHGVALEERLCVFSDEMEKIMDKFYEDHSRGPRDLVHVTSTGYVSPSPAQRLVSKKNWTDQTQVTHLYHMGCYAAVSAVRMVLRQKTANVDVVHTEVCTLHLDPSVHDPEQLILQSIFADGFSKYTLVSEKPQTGLKILKAAEKIIPASGEEMTWTPTSRGMSIRLSRNITDFIAQYVQEFLGKHLDFPRHRYQNSIFAIHPSGIKTIENLQSFLHLEENQVIHSQQVLLECGNMASATLPHIWEDIVADTNVPAGTPIVSLALGPGLTMAGALFEKV